MHNIFILAVVEKIYVYQARRQKLQLGGSFVQNCGLFQQNSGLFNNFVVFSNKIVDLLVKLWTFYLKGGFFRT